MIVIGKTLEKLCHRQSHDNGGKAVSILSCHLGSGVQAVACLQVHLVKCFINFSSLYTYCMTLTSHPLDLIILIIHGEEYKHKAHLYVIMSVLLIFFSPLTSKCVHNPVLQHPKFIGIVLCCIVLL